METALVCRYEGDMQHGKYHGKGKVTYKHSCYEGTFMNGQMHGAGKLTVKGGHYEGYWDHGVLADGLFIYNDGLKHKQLSDKSWAYCSKSDPRFYSECKDGISNGVSLRDTTPHDFGPQTPKDCYDVIDGYYDPLKHAVLSFKSGEVVRQPQQDEVDWILANCRVGRGLAMKGASSAI